MDDNETVFEWDNGRGDVLVVDVIEEGEVWVSVDDPNAAAMVTLPHAEARKLGQFLLDKTQ